MAVYSPQEHERLAEEAMTAPNESKEKKEKPQEKPAKTVKSGESNAEKPKTARKRGKADKQAPSEPEPEQVEWKGKVNKYTFLKLPLKLLKALKWTDGIGKKRGRDVPVTLTIDRLNDTIVVQRKKAP